MTKLSGLTAAARAGFAFLGHAIGNRGIRDGGRHSVWSADLAEMLQADLINLDCMAHGFRVDRATRH
jgi:hypothetical protein